jgi:pimeloyl-ACP methyl ester carboxylesterase
MSTSNRPETDALVHIEAGTVVLEGNVIIPPGAGGLILFAHGSGSSRHSPRNRYVAEALYQAGFGTLLFDLLTPREEAIDAGTSELRFNIDLLAERLLAATDWPMRQPGLDLPIGYFGASTGAAAALVAAAERSDVVGAVVSRGGRPDLAGDALRRVLAPTLLIVGGNDPIVIRLNRAALGELASPDKRLVIVPGAGHLFEEPGALDEVARLASDWFASHLRRPASARAV